MSRPRVIDEARIRKVAADNPDLLDCRLAQRFGITVGRLRKILGRNGRHSELPTSQELAKGHYTRRPGLSFEAQRHKGGAHARLNQVRRKLRREFVNPGSWTTFERSGLHPPAGAPPKKFRSNDDEA